MIKKIKAFTLLEVLFGMIISSLVISSAYLGYEMMVKRMVLFREVNKTVLDAARLKTILERDIFNAEELVMQEGLICRGPLPVYYLFGESIIVRKTFGICDTFRLTTIDLKGYFDGKDQLQPMTVIDKFVFKLKLFNEEESVVFRKEYGAQMLVNKQSER
jgi:hypothetical protein